MKGTNILPTGLSVPWIIQAFEYWIDRSNLPSVNVYIVMELVTGGTIGSYIEAQKHPRSRMRGGCVNSDDEIDPRIDSSLVVLYVIALKFAFFEACWHISMVLVHRIVIKAGELPEGFPLISMVWRTFGRLPSFMEA